MSLKELKPSEKKILIAGGVVFLIFILFMSNRFFGGSGGAGADDLRKLERARSAFYSDLKQYQAMSGTVKKIDARLEKTPPDFDSYGVLSSMVEVLSLREKIRNMSPHSGGGGNYYTEAYIDMELKELTIEDLVELLKKINAEQSFFKVSTLSIKRRFSEDKTLDVTMRVSLYGPKPPEEAKP